MLPAYPRKIAVLRAIALGDLVTALPALDALRARYPRAELVLLGRSLYRELLAGRDGPVDRVELVPPMTGIAERDGPPVSAEVRAEFVQRMRDERFDIVLQLHGGGQNANPLVRELGAAFTAGMRATGAPALNAWVPYVYYQPEVLRLLEVVSLVGAEPVTLRPHLAVNEGDVAASLRALPESGWPLALIHPGASDPRRRWPAERFAEVADALSDEGFEIAVIGQGEDPIGAQVIEAMRAPATDLSGRLSMSALVGALSRATLLVGNDSGPLHLANAVGTATVGVYWVGNLITAEPMTRATNRPVISWRVHCPECGADCTQVACPHDASFVDDVRVEDVLAEALDLAGVGRRIHADLPSRERMQEGSYA
jgi:ADP-heptose:LPS heptosyltransferase